MTAEDLRKAILQQAIQGKLVPQDPNDEPASVLLECIREEKARLVKEKKIKKDKNESIIYRGEDNSHYEKFADGTVKCIDDEIPFEIPQSWCWVRLICVGKTETGTTPSKTHPEYFGDYIPFIGPGNIQGNRIVSYTQGISEIGVDYCRPVPQNTILQVCIGGSIGKAAITTELSAFNQQINSIEPYQCVDYKYVFYTLLTDYFKRAMIDRSTGTATPIINRSNWEGIILPIPPQLEQQRIVARIEELMPITDKYEKSQEALDKLNADIFDKLKKSVLQEAIQGKLVPQDPNDEPASELLKRINAEKEQLIKDGKIKRDKNTSIIFKGDDNKYFEKKGTEVVCIDDEIPFEIPDSWEWVRFKNLVQFSLGKTPERIDSTYWSPNDYPWVSIADMEDKSTLTKTKEFISQKALTEKFNKTFSPIGTLIMSFKLTIGKVSILGINAVHNEAIISIFPFINEDNITRDYLYNFLSIITGYTASTEAIKGATLNSKKISEMLIPLPPLQEQKRIVKALDNVLTSIMRN